MGNEDEKGKQDAAGRWLYDQVGVRCAEVGDPMRPGAAIAREAALHKQEVGLTQLVELGRCSGACVERAGTELRLEHRLRDRIKDGGNREVPSRRGGSSS